MRAHLRSNPPSCSTGELPPGASTSLFLISLSKLPRTAWRKPGPTVWVRTSCVEISFCTVPDVTRTCRLRAKGCTTMVSGQVSSAHSVKPLALRADGNVHVIFHGRAASIMAPLVLHARAKLRSREPARAPPCFPPRALASPDPLRPQLSSIPLARLCAKASLLRKGSTTFWMGRSLRAASGASNLAPLLGPLHSARGLCLPRLMGNAEEPTLLLSMLRPLLPSRGRDRHVISPCSLSMLLGDCFSRVPSMFLGGRINLCT
jgi:hypothetical protein